MGKAVEKWGDKTEELYNSRQLPELLTLRLLLCLSDFFFLRRISGSRKAAVLVTDT